MHPYPELSSLYLELSTQPSNLLFVSASALSNQPTLSCRIQASGLVRLVMLDQQRNVVVLSRDGVNRLLHALDLVSYNADSRGGVDGWLSRFRGGRELTECAANNLQLNELADDSSIEECFDVVNSVSSPQAS